MTIMAPDLTANARSAARLMASVTARQRDAALEAIAVAIEQDAAEIEAANRLDVAAATATSRRPSSTGSRSRPTGSPAWPTGVRAVDRRCPTRSATCSAGSSATTAW